MNINVKIDFNRSPLDKMARELAKCEKYKVKVGVLNGGDYRDENNHLTVAGYGLINEFGNVLKNIPERSFIRSPLMSHLVERIVKDKEKFGEIYENKENAEGIYERMGIIAKSIIQEAFATSNDGNWAENSPITIMKKKSSKPLIDKGRLVKSIDYEVVEL